MRQRHSTPTAIRLLFSACLVLLTVGSVKADPPLKRLQDLTSAVRQQTVLSTSLLPESTLVELCQIAIEWTSIDCGGVEGQIVVRTVAGQKFYRIPDTVVEVLSATQVGQGNQYGLVAILPQWWEKLYDGFRTLGGSDGEEAYVRGYHYWDDTLQLLPAPSRTDDSIILKAYFNHPDCDTSAAKDTLRFKSGYDQAAFFYACYLADYNVKMFDDGDRYLAAYEKHRDALKATYARKFDYGLPPD